MIVQWKRQAKESLPEVFAKKTSRGAADREAEVKTLHAKIGQLTVENDFCRKPLLVEPRPKGRDGRGGSSPAQHCASV